MCSPFSSGSQCLESHQYSPGLQTLRGPISSTAPLSLVTDSSSQTPHKLATEVLSAPMHVFLANDFFHSDADSNSQLGTDDDTLSFTHAISHALQTIVDQLYSFACNTAMRQSHTNFSHNKPHSSVTLHKDSTVLQISSPDVSKMDFFSFDVIHQRPHSRLLEYPELLMRTSRLRIYLQSLCPYLHKAGRLHLDTYMFSLNPKYFCNGKKNVIFRFHFFR